jgi:glycosyltransferase involved in cell wall biosynthesis
VAAAITRVLRDHALAKRLASAARRRVETGFAVETMVRRTVAAYQGLLRTSLAPAAVAAA